MKRSKAVRSQISTEAIGPALGVKNDEGGVWDVRKADVYPKRQAERLPDVKRSKAARSLISTEAVRPALYA
jgi:hypothetical protein